MPEHEDTRPFLGWRVVGAAFTGQLIAAGVTFSAFGVFVVPLTEAFDTNVGRISLAFSVAFAVMMLVGPLVGHWLDRGLTRTLMLVGVSLSGLGLIGMSHATSLLQLGALYCGVVAIGAALFGLMPSMTLATNWFDRRRGLALGVTVAGATVATFIAPPAAAWLIERVGWRGALLWFGAAALVLGLPVFYRYTIARPEMVGQYPDGDPAPPAAEQGDGGEEPELETSALVRDRRLWFLSVGFALVFTSPIVMMLTLVPFAEGLGISRQEAAYFFSAAAPFSILSKVVFGAVSDRIPPRLAVWMVALINAAAWALLRLDPGYSFLLAIAVLYGIGIGAAGPLQGLLIARCFGPLAFGRAVGIGGLAALPLISGAPALAGFLFDTTGSYHLAFEIQAGAMLVGGVLLSIPRIPQR
ncbi:MAG: MFS transporter [bacterium]|nr:MFS transporter [bacterium]